MGGKVRSAVCIGVVQREKVWDWIPCAGTRCAGALTHIVKLLSAICFPQKPAGVVKFKGQPVQFQVPRSHDTSTAEGV